MKYVNVSKWSLQKLDMELGFAILSEDGSHRTKGWTNHIKKEIAKRLPHDQARKTKGKK